jgi:hypothetical protein
MRTEIVSYGSETAGAPEWIPLVFLGVVALILAAGITAGRRTRELFEAVSSFLPGELGGNFFLQNFSFRGNYKSRPVLLKYSPSGRNRPSYLHVSIEGPLFVFDLDITREDPVTSALDAIGLARDIRTGDKAFDSGFRIKSELPDLARKYLALPGVRERISALFGSDGFSLQLRARSGASPGLIKFCRSSPELERELSSQQLLPLLDELAQLSSPALGGEFFGPPPAGGFGPGRKRDY